MSDPESEQRLTEAFKQCSDDEYREMLGKMGINIPASADSTSIRNAAEAILRRELFQEKYGTVPCDVEAICQVMLGRLKITGIFKPPFPKPIEEEICFSNLLALRDFLAGCSFDGYPSVSAEQAERFEWAFAFRIRTPGEFSLDEFVKERGLSMAAAVPIILRTLERLFSLNVHDGDTVPASLRGAKRWCGYRKENDKKPPHSPVDGSSIGAVAKYQDHFVTFDEAVDGVERHDLDGLGFVLMEGDGLVGIDIDHAVEDGKINPVVEDWLKFFTNTYREFSPSGEGIHIICRGKLTGAVAGVPLPNAEGATVEIYSHDRYLTWTGKLIGGATDISDCQIALEKLLDHLEVKNATEPSGEIAMTPQRAGSVYTDLLEKLCTAVRGSRNNRLNAVSYFAARAHAGGLLNKDEATLRAEITSAARQAGLNDREIVQTFESGWQSGSHNKIKIRLMHHCTDLGNAERFILRHGDRVRYVPAYGRIGWLVWDGHRWKQDGERLVQELAQDTVRAIYLEAAAAEDSDASKRLASWATKSESARSVAAMLEMAQAGGVAVEPSKLDADPNLLNLENATLDLRTGEVREQRPSDLITRMLPVRYDPHASCPLFEKHLELVLPDPAVRNYFMEVVAYSLSGSTAEQCIHILLGDGETGKSTTSDLFRDMVGDYGLVVKRGLFIRQRQERSAVRACRTPGSPLGNVL